MAILGMTKMGKTTLTFRLAQELSTEFPVVILDQTGEYSRRSVRNTTLADLNLPSLTVSEVDASSTAPAKALKALRMLEELGREEYATGAAQPRVLILEEAHQFVPEPAMLGFGAAGRDEAIAFGLLMMQVRKFGISVVLISQRTAVLAKSALSQCENLIAFRSVDQTGLDYLEAVGGPHSRDLLPRLRQGEVLAMGPAISSESAVGLKLPRPD
jgi:DNA helicase HerA-like ATPase